MASQTTGIHHVTAISGEPQRNVDFYAGTWVSGWSRRPSTSTIPRPTTSTTATARGALAPS